MALSPETAISRINISVDDSSPPSNSSRSSPPPTNSSLPPPSSPPPQSPPPPSSSPPPAPANSPPPPLASPPPPTTSSPPPPKDSPKDSPEDSPSPPPPTQPQSPPPPNGSSSSPPPPSTTPSPPGPTPPPGTPPAPVFSPPPLDTGFSQTPPSSSRPSLSPPPPSRSTSPNRSSSGAPVGGSTPADSSDNISSGIIVGIVVGGLVVLVAILLVCVVYLRRKKRPNYYMDPGHPPRGGEQYFNGTPQWNSNPHTLDHIVKLPPPPGVTGTPVGGWGPSQAANTSSEYSSGYSGGGQHQTPPSPNMGGIGAKSQFTYEELAAATDGFSQANLTGQGGFGYVHKGILPDGKEVAVKSLKAGSGQGEREFQAEVEIISRVHHRHLVSLIGYCIADERRMLVYEFVPNKTMEFHLHGKGRPVMNWETRVRIALGSAKGLAYLHEDCHPRIIHRDIKAANILLDYNFEAMVADFGLAKLTSDNYTHVSTRVMGTFGYLAPEYASSGKLTEKSDVFSFGVMLLELITGRRPVDTTNTMMEDSLVDWARPLLTKALEDGNYSELVDPRLEDNYVNHELALMAACAAASIRHSARKRPKMSQIVRSLEGASSLDDLNEGVKPGQSAAYNPNGNSNIYDTRAYDADMMKFRKMVMSSSEEFNSSEYGATSEYGLNQSSSSSDSKEIAKTAAPKQKL
ncbi:hypothetical protein RD792_016964 [Penstemon davidsonii]|uniref:non-specific serine/threonine protein kinase n=1 Tax=Penstemon davidsonii TaxID=160366 RepID=A0ABR0CN82_9LAMI|nr:hypothetical protein RD792_016964 [Penstemon davidsonii]